MNSHFAIIIRFSERMNWLQYKFSWLYGYELYSLWWIQIVMKPEEWKRFCTSFINYYKLLPYTIILNCPLFYPAILFWHSEKTLICLCQGIKENLFDRPPTNKAKKRSNNVHCLKPKAFCPDSTLSNVKFWSWIININIL